ncbi:mitochondrial 37S ribosomal protein uS11m [Cenococcum geophilum 1.58]|uniref:mitochondrial 37S ribosomal protein uS11m n=1 Tax=Cenococcum geophilum 1.58 TaxID=794803 RepID=UPI00358FB9A5|nr:translational machinery component [Cenococcum geophilum 1.58]
MSRCTVMRLLEAFKPSICASCRLKLSQQPFLSRPFSSTTTNRADNRHFMDPIRPLESIASQFQKSSSSANGLGSSLIPDMPDDLSSLVSSPIVEQQQHHLHIYATKHNTHITLTKPNRDALISVSCGNIGFRKAGRGTYDAAYQLAAYVMSRIQDQGLLTQIKKLEIVYRGFGPGREAASKVIMGSEGRNIRNKIVKLTDATRLKFGGTRSPAPRRLG